MSSEANTQEVIVPRARDNLGRPVYTSQLTRTEDQRDKVLLVKQQVTIPVIFIPGIMGTNLRNKKTLNSVWSPPNASFSFGDIAGALGALFVWGFRGRKDDRSCSRPMMSRSMIVERSTPANRG